MYRQMRTKVCGGCNRVPPHHVYIQTRTRINTGVFYHYILLKTCKRLAKDIMYNAERLLESKGVLVRTVISLRGAYCARCSGHSYKDESY
mgnify:FL=1